MVLLAILSRYLLCLDSFRKRACLWLRICAEDPGIWPRIGHRFLFGDMLRIQASVCLRRLGSASGIRFGFGRLACTFGKALRIQECAIVLGLCSFRESREKGGSTVRSAGKSWKPEGGKAFVFPLVGHECSRGNERLTWSSVVPHGWI